ncbi:MAG: hypothetical protein WAU82_10260 [Candidatus Binatus sp.]|uniref:hypothetical protein n=1 Tax=Candidatus Binatus sp. TaxID=2811406 RepID=UPI003BB0C13C
MERKLRTTFVTAASGLLLLVVGLSGCSMFSTSNDPVDCNIVKTQRAAGQTDAQIASNLNATEDKVAACSSGSEHDTNKQTVVPEKGY